MRLDAPTAFHGSQRTVAATGSVSIVEGRFAAGVHLPRHLHADGYLCVVMLGGFREQVDGFPEIRATPGTVYYVPPGHRHTNAFGRGDTLCLRLELAEAMTDGLMTSERRLPRVAVGGVAMVAALRAYREALARPLGGGDVDTFAAEALESIHTERPRPPGPPPRWLQAARERLAQHGDAAPSLGSLAADAGVHPMHVARAFRQWYGCSVGQFRQWARVTRAATLLATTALPLADVALASGYSDQSHFSRVFRSRVGLTPSQFRVRRPPVALG